jgi:hypothetical protein
MAGQGNFLVFTPRALSAFVEAGRSIEYGVPAGDGHLGEDLVHVTDRDQVFFFHRRDEEIGRLIFLSVEPLQRIWQVGPEATARLFERIDRAARTFAQPNASIPRQWSKYSHDNLIAFFALPRRMAPDSYRWIAQILPGGSVAFWRLTGRGDTLPLADFKPDEDALQRLRISADRLLERVPTLLPTLPTGAKTLQLSVDLTAAGFQSVTQARTYSAWLPHLTEQQRGVVEASIHEGLKVRGQAGSGKTLTLELAVLNRVYDAIDRKNAIHLLFVTHSWAMEDQIQHALSALDERSVWREYVDVLPLTFLQEIIQGGPPEGVELLGEDSLEGKQLQLGLIEEAIGEVVRGSWETFRDGVSPTLRADVEAPISSGRRLSLAWMLMREFTEVIDANRLKPGLNFLRRYLELRRKAWMVPLDLRTDREFVFAVYRRYVERLVEEGQITTDQAIDDFRSYLESYAWNIRRTTEGYDAIFVDEFHLFNDTERYTLHLLTRNPDGFPVLVLASDPAQSPFALLTGLPDNSLSRLATERIGTAELAAVELSVLHRFTKPLFDFVEHIYCSLPNLVDLGGDWIYDLAPSSAGKADGQLPTVRFIPASEVAEASVERALSLNRLLPVGSRVAVLAVGGDDLRSLTDATGAHSNAFTLIEGRDDIYRLTYTRRTIVLTSAEYAAGLQFSHVVLVYGAGKDSGERGASANRAAISQLYLAATRAESGLHCFCADGETEVGNILKRAVEARVAIEERSGSTA